MIHFPQDQSFYHAIRNGSLLLCLAAWILFPRVSQADSPSHRTVRVALDYPVYVLDGSPDSDSVIIYLHGRCGNPLAGIRSFPEAIKSHGTMISVTGDEPCPKNPQLRRWGAGSVRIQARVEAAIQAASAGRSKALDAKDLTIVGYSEGALRAEAVAKKFPDRYARVALIGQPTRPSSNGFLPSQTIASVVGSRDYQQNMREGARNLEEAGLAVKFFLLPRAGHGEYGPDAERAMAEVFGHLFANRKQPDQTPATNKP